MNCIWTTGKVANNGRNYALGKISLKETYLFNNTVSTNCTRIFINNYVFYSSHKKKVSYYDIGILISYTKNNLEFVNSVYVYLNNKYTRTPNPVIRDMLIGKLDDFIDGYNNSIQHGCGYNTPERVNSIW
jgi:hypothetical protein